MKILLVVPRYNFSDKIDYRYSFPIGIAYISAVLKKENYEVDCINLNHFNGTISELINKALSKINYDFLCVGHMGSGYAIVKKIIDVTKNHNSCPRVILGGAIISSEPEFIFKSLNPDFGVIGEGEETIIELLNSIKNKKNLEEVPGIIFRKNNGEITLTKKREVIKNLDSLPFPDLESLGLEEQLNNMYTNDSYIHNLFDNPRIYPILGSRSCPFQCTFCYHVLGRKYRTRSIENIIREIKLAIKKYNINGLSIYDDLFSADKKRLYDFCDALKKIIKGLPVFKWTCQLSVHNVDEEMLKKLKSAGCEVVSFGFESIHPQVLKSMKKPITPNQIDNAIKLCFKEKMGIQGNFIFGDIAETNETSFATIEYWKKNCRGQIGLDFIQPYPGSEIYSFCLKKEIIKDKLKFVETIGDRRWYNMTNEMSDLDILRLKKNILNSLVKYRKNVLYSGIQKTGKNKFGIKAKCPYCNKINWYRNFFILNPQYFSEFMTCRNCYMRFGVSSSLKRLIWKFSPLIQSLMENALKIKKSFLKKRI